MERITRRFAGAAGAVLVLATALVAGAEVGFPTQVRFEDLGEAHELHLTGEAVRTKYFFDVYRLAHYMQATVPDAQRVLSDASAKQVIMEFSRHLGADLIRTSLRSEIQRRSTPAEFEALNASLDVFSAAITQDADTHDRFVIRWLPGGTTVSLFEGREVSRIEDPSFAQALWSIWFGADPVVDRDQLVSKLPAPRETLPASYGP